MKKNNKKKIQLMPLLLLAVFGAVGFFGAGLAGAAMDAMQFTANASLNTFIVMAIACILLCAALVIHIIIHESGHLVFGLISGYKFNSFRIFNFMLIREEGRLAVKRLTIAGTGGQCLMSPPEAADGKIPVVLYNLGGSLMNLIFALIVLPFAILIPSVPVLSLFLVMFVFYGFVTAAINGIPISGEAINNDGHNAISLSRDPDAVSAFSIQLRVNDMISRGVRLKDMPSEWFELPRDEQMKNSIHATIAVFSCNRLMDEMKFAEADERMKTLLSMDSGIIGVHRQLLICDRIFCELVLRGSETAADGMRDEQYLKFAKVMKKFPSIIRTEYAYVLLVHKDPDGAARIRNSFERMAEKYPYPSDIKSERELLMLAEKTAVERGIL